MKEDIRKLIESDITGYKIKKETGISESTISRIRRGQIDIGSITLDNALKLYEFYQNHKNEIKPPQQ
ncbi:helix-turn-helix domain-containing protein [Virgibacillus sp. AGTR]|uniref:helix-turn-helix domain-containing protein n=1 Tax=Virgibacillus sp. AGTR TaxID=2812055 RepID=UPI001D166048|nr:helix-turn-helix domain-containing protein [Virgibacillus sp. AGTR]MCC2250091.1 helix-turn-helix domain-containing protein [Virgibacillus sp. AGTR]